jgi:hypothetical protein
MGACHDTRLISAKPTRQLSATAWYIHEFGGINVADWLLILGLQHVIRQVAEGRTAEGGVLS